jgi:hypothetical protein
VTNVSKELTASIIITLMTETYAPLIHHTISTDYTVEIPEKNIFKFYFKHSKRSHEKKGERKI